MSKVYKCDKCGRVIERGEVIEHGARIDYIKHWPCFGYGMYETTGTRQIDLCDACATDFESWLKSRQSFAGAVHACGAGSDGE